MRACVRVCPRERQAERERERARVSLQHGLTFGKRPRARNINAMVLIRAVA